MTMFKVGDYIEYKYDDEWIKGIVFFTGSRYDDDYRVKFIREDDIEDGFDISDLKELYKVRHLKNNAFNYI